MANNNPKLPLTGRNISITVFVDRTPLQQTDLATSVEIDEQVIQYRDKYLGRDRDRTDEQTIGWDGDVELDYAGSQLIAALLAQKEAKRLNQQPKDISLGMILTNRDGTIDSYVLQRCSSKINFGFRDKDARGKIKLKLQGEDLKQQAF